MIVNEADINALTQRHLVFKEIQLQYGNPPSWQRPQGFESLCKIILEQQVSLASAAAHFAALKKYIGKCIPENILKLTPIELRDCFISKQKGVYLKALAEAVVSKTINFAQHSKMLDAEVRAELIAVKGIGVWTADVYLMMCLQRKSIFPVGDIALQQAAKKLFTITTKEELIALSETWHPLKSLAAFFLWHWYLSNKQSRR